MSVELLDFPSEEASLGPRMRALSDRQRRFVRAAMEFPTGKGWQIAKAAGYSAKSHGYLRLAAHRLFHDEAIIAAMHEEAGKRLRSSAVLGASVLAKIARTDGHRDQLKAAEALLNRVGLHERTEHFVNVNHSDTTSRAMFERIKELAGALGVDPAALLGPNAPVEPMKVIEGEVVEERDAGSTRP
jgi:phage terminase small subunit